MNTTGSDAGRRGADVMDALRAADPATRADLTRTDDRAFMALREGITMTAREQAGTTKRRGRRTLVAGGLALALVGGGTAYAAFDRWYGGGGGAGGGEGGVSCLSHWVDPMTADDGEFADAAVGGPPITGDPVVDCQSYMKLSGKPEIPDAVAFEFNGTSAYVTPRSEVPASAVPLPPTTGGAAFELKHSFSDLVDGGNSKCFTAAEALAFAKAEVTRLGLDDWTVTAVPSWGPADPGGPCAWVGIEPEKAKTVFAAATGASDNSIPNEGTDPSVYTMRDAFKDQIADKCLSLTDAQRVTATILGQTHHWPTGSVEDATMKCTTVDMVVGGSTQIFLRGPATITN